MLIVNVAAASLSMYLCMAFRAQRDQVLLLVATCLAAEFEMVHLQILHATADLTSPAVPLQHLPMQFVVVRRIESEPRIFDTDIVHDACPATPDKNASYKFLPAH